jgi:hypothetical protein
MMLDAYGQDVLARCGFKALKGHPYDPVFQKEAGFLFLMTTGLKGGGRVIHNSRCDPNPFTEDIGEFEPVGKKPWRRRPGASAGYAVPQVPRAPARGAPQFLALVGGSLFDPETALRSRRRETRRPHIEHM